MGENSSIITLRLACEEPVYNPFPENNDQKSGIVDRDLCASKSSEFAFDATSGMDSELKALSELPLKSRLACITKRFIGLPYKLDPLGEGIDASVDKDPTFRFDAHDCMTMIEHVMALGSAKSSHSFMDRLTEIRYRSALIAYGFRLHFVSADWIPENTENGFIREITHAIGGDSVKTVSAEIDRSGWISSKKDLNPVQKALALGSLFVTGKYGTEYVTMDYIPTSAFFMSDPDCLATPINPVDLLPEVSLMLMIDDQKDIDRIGVIVRHMALLFNPKGEEPFIVHGSSRRGEIYAESFLTYISSQAPYRAGVALFEILDKSE